MEPLDVATPMGVLITAAIFFEGHASVRRQAILSDLPRAYAAVIQPGKKWTGTDIPSAPGFGTATVALTLFLLNALLFLGGWSIEDFRVSLPAALLAAFLVAHAVVMLSGQRSVREGREAQERTLAESAYSLLLEAKTLEIPPVGQPGRIGRAYESAGLHEAALARVPAGVDDGTYRVEAAESHVTLAEALIEDRRPLPALRSLDRADAESRRAGWLEAYGGHDAADLLADKAVVGRAQLRARAHSLMGNQNAEFEAWMAALRSAPAAMQAHTGDLLDTARRASRIRDLHQGLHAIVGNDPDSNSWGRALLDGVAVKLGHSLEDAEDLDELRLQSWLYTGDRVSESPYALNLVEALLATSRKRDLCEAETIVEQVTWVPELRWGDQWMRFKIETHLRRGDTDGAFRLLTRWLGDDPNAWRISQFNDWIDVAAQCQRLDELLAHVGALEVDESEGGAAHSARLARRLRRRLDEAAAAGSQ